MRRTTDDAGFTLLEALVAIALLAVVLIHFLGTRTEALMDAANARNWRIAREIAEHRLSVIEAGAHELPPENRTMVSLEEDYPGFRYQVLIGEASISEVESQIAESASGGEDSEEYSDRLQWQRERENRRKSEAAGLSYYDYEEQLRQEELEDRPPSETEFEDVAVLVYFLDIRAKEGDPEDATFMLRAKVSTMAIAGLTPEESEARAEREGRTPEGVTGAGPAVGGN